jgi:DNA-binding transcriptional LysR family regulator
MIASPTELAYFIEVANTLNLSRASERLGISQPSLSIAIKKLETSIGTELLLRHKRGVTLTQAGKQLLAHTKKLHQYWEEVKTQTLASHQAVQGRFIIGCHPSIALHHVKGREFTSFLADLLSQHPKLEVAFQHEMSRKITERVINLSIDIGIVANPIKHPDLVINKLVNDEVTFYQSAQHTNANQCMKSGNAVIICDDEMMQVQSLLKTLQKKGMKFNRVLTSSNLEVIASLTAQGCGIGILPGSVGMGVYADRLKPYPKMPVYHDEICLIYRNENRGLKAMQVMLGAIKKLYQ